ncbi:hypothetical protein HPP92_004136 [Vanilla planifolia]|uniref:Pentatricopeptide repeat-containing protein n=1 Tax=Vanilla planifolia TaxID=51239 RepID=A0A835RVR8_VANPL|nr:hypothetical protein HPP92_004136 [Vanilla planifolia]
MTKGDGKVLLSAVWKAFKKTGVGEVRATSDGTILKKLVPKPKANPSTPPISPTPVDKAKAFLPDLADKFVLQLKKGRAENSEESPVPAWESCAEVTQEISSILPSFDEAASLASQSNYDELFTNQPQNCMNQRKKEMSRFRKQKAILKNSQPRQFQKLMKICLDKLDAESTVGIFYRFGREISMKEYLTLIKLLIEKARNSSVQDSLVYVQKLYKLFVSMRERGFQISEDSYGPFLLYLTDINMKTEFINFCEFMKDYDHESYTRLGYYEMLFWIKVGDENKIKELCSLVATDGGNESNGLAESYLLALCQSDMKDELILSLEAFDMGNMTSLKHVSCIFKSMGVLQLEKHMLRFIFALKTRGTEETDISSFIYDYASSLPNLAVEDILSTFDELHEKADIMPSIASCEKLIKLCCSFSKVRAALHIADRMCKCGSPISVESFHPILQACENNFEFELVNQIYSVIRHHNLKPGADAIKIMIVLCVKMKDFESAFNFLNVAREMKVVPTAGMYNAILAGYFREKKDHGALAVLQQMKDADVKPDSETYSYLISNCRSEKDIVKYHDEMQHAGVQATKYVYMALINAYANFQNFEMAKQNSFMLTSVAIFAWNKHHVGGYLNDVRSVLLSALSSNGQISEALHQYDEIKQTGNKIEPKAAICLIEHLQAEGNLDRLLQLLGELDDSSYWFDGCSRVVLYCVQWNLASAAIQLLKTLKEADESSTYIVIDQVFSRIWEMETTNVEIGLELLRAIKDLHLSVTRTSLDFLLSCCVKTKDPLRAQLIWSEYEDAGLPYNILTLLRMYEVLLAAEDDKEASKILKRIPKDDPHVCYVIESCKATYAKKLCKGRTK